MKYIVTINGISYEVEVERGQASVVKVPQNTAVAPQTAAPISGPVQPVQPAVPAQTSVQPNVTGEMVKSPMPGTILDVKVTPGLVIKKGDILFILEAMKMENEIMAPRDGVVAQIVTAKGANVATGDILAVLQ